jgi:glycosyltransferase involved in cell wall biosynthesis
MGTSSERARPGARVSRSERAWWDDTACTHGGSGPDDPRERRTSLGEPELESVLIDWYRARLGRITGGIDPPRDPCDLERQAVIEDSLGRRRRPPEESRRWLEKAYRSSASHEIRLVNGIRAGLVRSGRRMIRPIVGRGPYQHGRISRASTTRVLHAIADLQIGGAQQLVIDLAGSTRRAASHHVLARSVSVRFRPSVRFTEDGGNRSRIRRLFDHHRPEVLHLCHYRASPETAVWYDLVARIAIERDVPIVQSHCVIGEPWLGTDRQHLVFCSEWSRARSGLAGIPDSVISPGTPFEVFRAPRSPISSEPVVGMVYRLDGDKIDASAARAIGCVLRETPQARFEVVGDGPVRPRMQRALQEAGFSDRITWHGYVPFSRLASIHRSFDVEIAPVVADTFGSGTVHAIASGTPVVGYGIAALPELLRSEAAIAAPESPDAIGRKVGAILRDDDLHARVHSDQWNHASTNFGIDAMIDGYHRLFSEVAGGRTPMSSG